ncbi:hypothetical protein SCUCBS95973_007122 [Sporothrix curviconia]|uniref:Peptidase A2 domain-containing protein n=1 Tax=Sporothrix curviconia TaxID=1260050 RepID=A0ABP0CAT9_9PEZI
MASPPKTVDPPATGTVAAPAAKTAEHVLYKMLFAVGYSVYNANPKLNITMPVPFPRAAGVLRMLLSKVQSDNQLKDAVVFAPIDHSSKKQQALRQMAREYKLVLDAEAASSSTAAGNENVRPISRPILSDITLGKGDVPKPLSEESRQKLKEEYKDFLKNDAPPPFPFVSVTVAIEERNLPTVSASCRLSRFDGISDSKQFFLGPMDCLWDTGAQISVVSDDLIPADFLEILHSEELNKPYITEVPTQAGTQKVVKVQISAIIALSNSTIEIETMALVMPRECIPNKRSGVILGQRGLINSIQYTSIPREILVKQYHQVIEEKYWGRFEVTSYYSSVPDEVTIYQ